MPVDADLSAVIADHLQTALQLRDQPHLDAVQQLGRNCHMPNALQTPLHTVLHQEWLLQQQGLGYSVLSTQQKQHVYVAAIRGALAAGGCCASRAGYAGACLGMMLGVDAVPEAWLERSSAGNDVQKWAQQICDSRSAC